MAQAGQEALEQALLRGVAQDAPQVPQAAVPGQLGRPDLRHAQHAKHAQQWGAGLPLPGGEALDQPRAAVQAPLPVALPEGRGQLRAARYGQLPQAAAQRAP